MVRLENKFTGEVVANLDHLPKTADVNDILELDGELWQIENIDDYKSGAWVYAKLVRRFEVDAIPDEPWRGAERREE